MDLATTPTTNDAYTSLISADAAVAAARVIAPAIAAHRETTEGNRRLSDEVVDAIKRAGLFGLMGARSFGGSEIGVEALIRVTMTFAEQCGSTGWVFGVLAGHSWMLNLFPAQVQREVAAKPGALTATLFRLGAEIERVEGGYRVRNGTGRFCSGVDFADWVIVGASIRASDGPPDARFLLIPRSDIEIVDDWHTVGMRGTGSRSIRIAEAFVPALRSVAVADMVAGVTPGAAIHAAPIYRMPFGAVTPYSIAGAPLGMALGARKAFAEALRRTLDPATPLRGSQETVLTRYAKASTMIDAAITLVLADARKIDTMVDRADFDELALKTLPRNWSWAMQACRDAVNDLFELSGGSAIYDSSLIQRHWRDINSAAQHVGFAEDKAMLDHAHVEFGLPAEAYSIPTSK